MTKIEKKIEKKVETKVEDKKFVIDKDIQDKLDNLTTNTSKIIYLDSLNFTRTQITKNFNLVTKQGNDIRYQNVRNVLELHLLKKKVNKK